MATYTNPPLAGRPPYATDEPDSVYERSPQQTIRRIRETPANPNGRTSAYDIYENYLERQSGVNAVGLGLLNMADDDEDEDDDQPPKQRSHPTPNFPVPSASAFPAPPEMPDAPFPAVGAPINRPPQAAVPEGRRPAPLYQVGQRTGPPAGLTLAVDASAAHNSPYGPKSPAPSTPHPLQAPMTPIIPAFARPPKAKTEVKFASSEPIMRGGSEDMLIPKRGEQGDDFWRRFSMVAKEENRKPSSQKQSTWLKKSQNGNDRLSRMVWIIGLVFVLCIAGAGVLGWYLTHNNSHQQPTAIGGSAGETQPSAPSSTAVSHVPDPTTVIQAVHPTNTVARREFVDAAPTSFVARRNHSKRTHRSH